MLQVEALVDFDDGEPVVEMSTAGGPVERLALVEACVFLRSLVVAHRAVDVRTVVAGRVVHDSFRNLAIDPEGIVSDPVDVVGVSVPAVVESSLETIEVDQVISSVQVENQPEPIVEPIDESVVEPVVEPVAAFEAVENSSVAAPIGASVAEPPAGEPVAGPLALRRPAGIATTGSGVGRSRRLVLVSAVVCALLAAGGVAVYALSSPDREPPVAAPVEQMVWASPAAVDTSMTLGGQVWSVKVPVAATVVSTGDWLVVTGNSQAKFVSAVSGKTAGKPVSLVENPRMVAPVRIDGRDVVALVAGDELVVWESATITRVKLPAGAKVSADGGHVLVIADSGVFTVTGGQLAPVEVPHGGTPVALSDAGLVEVLPPGRVAGPEGPVALKGPTGAVVSRWLGAGADWVAVVWTSADGAVVALHDTSTGVSVSAVKTSRELGEASRWVRAVDRSVAAFGPFVVDTAERQISVDAGGGGVFASAVPGVAVGQLDGAGVWVRSTGQAWPAQHQIVGRAEGGLLLRDGKNVSLMREGNL